MGLSEGEDRITRLHETESGYVSVSVIGEEIVLNRSVLRNDAMGNVIDVHWISLRIEITK